jgi:uncharacterized protein (DUF433 family)
MATAADIGTLITQSPEVCGGRPRVAGTGMSVMRIAGWHRLGCNPEEIARKTGLTLAQIHAALLTITRIARQLTLTSTMKARNTTA